MKILQYEECNGRVLVTVLYEDNTFATLNMLNTGNRDEILKDVYIISSDVRNRQPFEGEIPTDLETYHKPQSSPTYLTDIDFSGLKAKVYNQFGEIMDTNATFIIEGDGAKIQEGKIVENTVSVDTPYTIIAAVGDLSERQERTIYAPAPEIPDSDAPVSRAEYEELKAALEAMLVGGI